MNESSPGQSGSQQACVWWGRGDYHITRPCCECICGKRLQVIQMPHLGALSGSYLSWGSTVSKAEAEVLVDPGQSFYFPDTNRLRLGKQV